MFRARRSVSGTAVLLQRLNFTGALRLHATGDSSHSLRHERAMCCRVYRRLLGERESLFSSDLARMAALASGAPREYSSYRNTGTLTYVSARSPVLTHARPSSTKPDNHERAPDVQTDHVSSVSGAEGQGSDVKPSKTQQLRKVFKEYGAVGVSFHIGISLMSLGIFYLAVSSGLDMAAVLCKLGFSEAVVRSKMAAGTSTFVLAYAVHKLFAPVRISITLVSVPLIVRHLRKTGLFKTRTSGP